MGSVEGQPNNARMPRRRSTFNRNLMAAALLAAGVIVSTTGCSSSGGKSAAGSAPTGSSPSAASASASSGFSTPSDSAPASSASSAPTAEAGQDALAAYRAAFVDWQAAGATSNYQDPALSHHMSGEALSYVTRSMYISKTEGAVSEGAPVLHPTVGQMVPATTPTRVVVNDCWSDASWLMYTTDHHLFNNVPGGNHKSQALVVNTNGVWKVDQLLVQPVGSC